MTDVPRLVESWRFYEDLARTGEYGEGEIVSEDGELALRPELEVEARFFITHLGMRRAVVDVGCGLGFPSLVLAPHVGRLIAFDAAPTMVRRLQSHVQRLGYDTITVVQARAEALPFTNHRFDGAAICGTLGSLTRPQRMLEELHRVIQPGGIVACVAANFAHQLVVDRGKEFRWFRMTDGELCLQVIEYLRNPYRIRDYRYTIRHDSELYRRLTCAHEGERSWREPTDQTPDDLAQGVVAEVLYDEAIMFDPTTLVSAFRSAGFALRTLELSRHFPVEHIFACCRRE